MKLALGTVQFGLDYGIANERGRVSVEEAAAIVRYAESRGIDTLDTAMAYGDSEQRLGDIGVEAWRVVSKLPALPADLEDPAPWMSEAVRRSAARLRIPRLYGLLLHRPSQLLERRGARLFSALQELKQEGVVRKVGISIYDPAELDDLHPRFTFDIVQCPFNLLDRRLIETGWLSRLAAQGVEVHLRSVFLQGLLLMPGNRRPAGFNAWDSIWKTYDRWLMESALSPLEACLRDALSVRESSHVVIGVDSPRQLAEIIEAADGPAPNPPSGLATTDELLINPARWAAIA